MRWLVVGSPKDPFVRGVVDAANERGVAIEVWDSRLSRDPHWDLCDRLWEGKVNALLIIDVDRLNAKQVREWREWGVYVAVLSVDGCDPENTRLYWIMRAANWAATTLERVRSRGGEVGMDAIESLNLESSSLGESIVDRVSSDLNRT